MTDIDPRPTDCLLVIDVQDDFCPETAVAVPDSDAVITPISALMARFDHVVLTQDWHQPGHSPFAASTLGRPSTT